MTKELLFELRPAEFWVWNYLLVLAREQGGSPVTIPGPGKDPRVEKVYSRKHLIRLLRSLRRKACLTRIIIPRSKSNTIEVFIPISLIGEIHVLNNGTSGTPMSPIHSSKSGTSSTSTFNKPSYSFKELKEAKQGELIKMIRGLDQVTVRRYRGVAERMIMREPRCKVSEKAKLFAEMRYIQEDGNITRPQAWLDTVARKAKEHFA
jgi:hypothetical protein